MHMTYWYTIQDMADRATIETNKLVTAKDVFKLAEQGVVRVGAVTGDNELQWHYQDGSIVEKSNVTTDGVARWLDTTMLDRLAVHGQVKIAGLQWPISGSTTLTAGPDSPFVKMDDLRVPESEYSRLLSAINGKSVAPRELEGTAPTPKRLAAEPGAHLIRQWQDLAERIVKLRESESNIPPSEQEAAIRLRNGFEGERRQLEAKPEFLSALDSYLTRLEATHEGIARSGQQALIEQSAARIESWSEHLARLRASKQTGKPRMSEMRAFLKHCIEKEKLKDIESIWQYIRTNAGKDGFLFKMASKDAATTVDDETVEKKNLDRQLRDFLKVLKNA